MSFCESTLHGGKVTSSEVAARNLSLARAVVAQAGVSIDQEASQLLSLLEQEHQQKKRKKKKSMGIMSKRKKEKRCMCFRCIVLCKVASIGFSSTAPSVIKFIRPTPSTMQNKKT